MSENAAVAVLGPGIMGAAMARNLLAAGKGVRAWNRTPEKADPLANDGATIAASPAEATEGAEFTSSRFAPSGVRRAHEGYEAREPSLARGTSSPR